MEKLKAKVQFGVRVISLTSAAEVVSNWPKKKAACSFSPEATVQIHFATQSLIKMSGIFAVKVTKHT